MRSSVGGSTAASLPFQPATAELGLVSRASSAHAAMRNYSGHEGRSFEFDNQVLNSSHRKLLWSNAHGGESCGKVET